MDPWCSSGPLTSEKVDDLGQQKQGSLLSSSDDNSTATFQDNFIIKSDLTQLDPEEDCPDRPAAFVKLPDSEEYLASLGKHKLWNISLFGFFKLSEQKNLKVYKMLPNNLAEKRLSKIQQQPNILRSLQESKEAALRSLLLDTSPPCPETDLDQDEELKKANLLFQKLAPEKQALSTQELVHLLDADHLQVGVAAASISTYEEENEVEVTTTSTSSNQKQQE